MITYTQALSLIKKYKLPEVTVSHSKGVSQICFEIANAILGKNPGIGINPEKVRIAGLLHDIGRSKSGTHEMNTMEILQAEDLPDIAEIAAHGFLFEYYKLQGQEKNDYLPKTLENKIVVLSDMYYNQNQERVTLDERFDDILKRYSEDPEFIKIVQLAKPRMEALEREILALM